MLANPSGRATSKPTAPVLSQKPGNHTWEGANNFYI